MSPAPALPHAIAEIALESTIVLGLAFLADRLLRSAAHRIRYALWTISIVGCLALLVGSLAQPGIPLGLLPIRAETTVTPDLPSEALRGISSTRDRTSGWHEGSAASDSRPTPDTAAVASPPNARTLVPTVVTVVWIAGLVVVLLTVASGAWRLHRLTRLARPARRATWRGIEREAKRVANVRARVRLLQHEDVRSPMAWGAFRPVVLMPADAREWPAERRRIVLLHELVHVRRHDWIVQVCTRLCCAALWFSPLAWAAARRLAQEREHACDEAVLALGTRASSYATHLLEIASMTSRRSRGALALTLASRNGLERRLRAILSAHEPSRRPVFHIATAALACMLLVGLSAVDPLGRSVEAASSIDTQSSTPDTSSTLAIAPRDPRIEELERRLAAAPDDTDAWLELATVHDRAGDYDRAVPAYRAAVLAADRTKTVEFSPRKKRALYALARSYARLGRTDAALGALERAFGIGPLDYDAVRGDEAFASLRLDPRFDRIIDNAYRLYVVGDPLWD